MSGKGWAGSADGSWGHSPSRGDAWWLPAHGVSMEGSRVARAAQDVQGHTAHGHGCTGQPCTRCLGTHSTWALMHRVPGDTQHYRHQFTACPRTHSPQGAIHEVPVDTNPTDIHAQGAWGHAASWTSLHMVPGDTQLTAAMHRGHLPSTPAVGHQSQAQHFTAAGLWPWALLMAA